MAIYGKGFFDEATTGLLRQELKFNKGIIKKFSGKNAAKDTTGAVKFATSANKELEREINRRVKQAKADSDRKGKLKLHPGLRARMAKVDARRRGK